MLKFLVNLKNRIFYITVVRFIRFVLGLMPLSWIDPLARGIWKFKSFFSKKHRYAGLLRAELGAKSLKINRKQALQACHGDILEHLLDLWVYQIGHAVFNKYGFKEAIQELTASLKKLQKKYPNRPIILSPFHYVSTYCNVMICEAIRANLKIETLSIVSAIPSDMMGIDSAIVPHIQVLQTAEGDSRQTMGLALVKAMKKQGVVVIFTDVPPYSLIGFPRETIDITLMKRPARIHSGAFRLGKRLNAFSVPFYIKLQNGRIKIHVFDPIDLTKDNAAEKTGKAIEIALKDNYQQWMAAGHPSFYWFAPAR